MLSLASTTPYLRFLVTNSYEISDDAPSPIDLNHGEGASATQNESEASTTFNNRDEIVALSSWCTAPSGSGCNRCLSACPHEAITLNDQGPEIDEALCTRCGICSGVCDAFAWSRITLENLAALRRLSLLHLQRASLRRSCSSEQRNNTSLPCQRSSRVLELSTR